jgi:uncharacterized protein YbaP (TraB family)
LETTTDEASDTGGVFLDLYLAQKSRENHKTVKGLETAAEQLKALNALSYEDQIEVIGEDTARRTKSGKAISSA